jgi:hypothetical protein
VGRAEAWSSSRGGNGRGWLHNPARDSGSGVGERTHDFGKSRGGDDLLRRESAYMRKGGEWWGVGGAKGVWD